MKFQAKLVLRKRNIKALIFDAGAVPISLRELSFLFREFYQNRQFFRERNSGGRTFLFQRVANRKELEEAKQAEGYA
jgi:hypothetical protein